MIHPQRKRCSSRSYNKMSSQFKSFRIKIKQTSLVPTTKRSQDYKLITFDMDLIKHLMLEEITEK